jgi:hypothetical protein
MLTPDAIAELAALGFSFDAEPYPLGCILAEIRECAALTDCEREYYAQVIGQAVRAATKGWIPVVA